MCKDPARSAEVERKPFEVSEWIKLRRNSAFVHRALAERSAEVEKTLWRVQSLRSSGGTTSLECRRIPRLQGS
jgi:hypothetical protein